MNCTKIQQKDKSRQSIDRGVGKVADIVRVTLGPKGRNVILDQGYLPPLITNDGVTIARHIVLEDPYENIGAQVIKEVCTKTNDIAGDGTTTAIVLSQSLISQGIRNINSGANPVLINQGIKNACQRCIDHISSNAKLISNDKELFQIASISAGNEDIGKIISDTIKTVGSDGVVTIEESNNLTTSINIVSGMQLDRGYLSPYMSTDMEKMEVFYDNPKVFITDNKLTLSEILPILEQTASSGTKLFIICEDIDNEALSTIVLNKMRGNFACTVIKAPGYGDRKQALLQDISCLCNTKVYSSNNGDDLRVVTIDSLGQAKKIKSTKDSTTIIGIHNPLLEERISYLKTLIDESSGIDRDLLKQRLAKLTGGVAVLQVGADTEVEMREKKLRIEDALNATQSAMQEGIVAGGGIALLSCKKLLNKYIKSLSGDEKIGATIVSYAIEAPIRQIINNAGLEDGLIISKILSKSEPNYGYDAMNNKFCNMIQCGIIDPAKVTISALKSACSVATTLLTTEGIVVKTENKD